MLKLIKKLNALSVGLRSKYFESYRILSRYKAVACDLQCCLDISTGFLTLSGMSFISSATVYS